MLIITNKLTIETHLMWSREFGGAYVWWWKTGLGESGIRRRFREVVENWAWIFENWAALRLRKGKLGPKGP